ERQYESVNILNERNPSEAGVPHFIHGVNAAFTQLERFKTAGTQQENPYTQYERNAKIGQSVFGHHGGKPHGNEQGKDACKKKDDQQCQVDLVKYPDHKTHHQTVIPIGSTACES